MDENAAAPELFLIRITQGNHESEYVSGISGFPLPSLRGQKWFLNPEVGMAYRFFLPAAQEMVAHVNKHYVAELLPIKTKVIAAEEPAIPFAHVPIEGVPQPHGWALRYVSGMGPEIKEGFWFRQASSVHFGFEPVLLTAYDTQERATEVSDHLRSSGIETQVVKV